jgi:plasmid maintenance system antidote protein VapI
MIMVSRKFVEAVKLSDLRAYEIAHKAEIHPTTLSRILNGIEDVKPGDPRVLRIGKVLGLRSEDCFDSVETARG